MDPFIGLDNATTHEAALPDIEKHFNVLFMPPYSPRFNSFEVFWGHFKRRVHLRVQNEFLSTNRRILSSKSQFEELCLSIARETPMEIVDNLSRVNYKYILEILGNE